MRWLRYRCRSLDQLVKLAVDKLVPCMLGVFEFRHVDVVGVDGTRIVSVEDRGLIFYNLPRTEVSGESSGTLCARIFTFSPVHIFSSSWMQKIPMACLSLLWRSSLTFWSKRRKRLRMSAMTNDLLLRVSKLLMFVYLKTWISRVRNSTGLARSHPKCGVPMKTMPQVCSSIRFALSSLMSYRSKRA